METEAKPRILIVEDTPENIRLLVETLKDDHIVLATKSGEKGLRLARTEPRPDLILLDIMMPGMDGYAVCEALKADPRTRDIPVLFVTALTDERDEARGLALGAADYIVKPFRPAIVRARVRTQVESGAISLNLGIVAPEGIPAAHRFPVDFQPGECDYICLSVADEGEGIPRENIERLFDPFFSTRFTGRGLGLPVALGIAKAHGGCIALSNAPDGGTAFRVYLPLTDEAPLRAEPSASGPTDFAHGRETRSD